MNAPNIYTYTYYVYLLKRYFFISDIYWQKLSYCLSYLSILVGVTFTPHRDTASMLKDVNGQHLDFAPSNNTVTTANVPRIMFAVFIGAIYLPTGTDVGWLLYAILSHDWLSSVRVLGPTRILIVLEYTLQ